MQFKPGIKLIMLSSPSGNFEQVGLKVDDFYQKVYMNIFLPWSWDEISHG